MIRARTRQQAMDWSLVLLSQGIASVIQERETGWGLSIEPQDHEQALAVLRKYRQENRRWHWHQRLRWPEFSFHFGVLVWCLGLVMFYRASSGPGAHLKAAGTLHSEAVLSGAWWQLFTAVVLHADLGHLMANLTAGFLLLGLAMGRYGAGCALLAAYLAGAAGNLVGVLLRSEPYVGLGASGMVMGGLGLLAIQSLAVKRARPFVTKYLSAALFAGLMLFVLLGVDPGTDVLAHLGGFLTGLFFGGIMSLVPAKSLASTAANGGAGVSLGLLLAITWAMAFR
jgi:rhomboid protease GluP